MTAPTPVTVVSPARIQDLGATNVGDVLNTLPSFRASTNPQTDNIQPREAGTTQADLRGLGPNRTLVLVNGRRFIPSTLEGTVDLNQIPTLTPRSRGGGDRWRIGAIRLGRRSRRGQSHSQFQAAGCDLAAAVWSNAGK